MWNPFSKKQDPGSDTYWQDALDDLKKQLGSQQQSSGTSLLPAQPGTYQVSAYLQSPFTTQQELQDLLRQFSISGLTADEKVEFDKLTEEFKAEVKISKIATFKKLPTELRQFVVNFFAWQESINVINTTTVDKSERLKELEQKNEAGKLFSQQLGQYMGSTYTTTGLNNILFQIGLPDGLTIEELKQAHIEASMEEEMLNGEK